MKSLLLINFLFLLAACGQNNCCVPLLGDDNEFSFSVKNENGKDLLNRETEGYYFSGSIKVFELVKGEYVEVLTPDSRNPRGFQIAQIDSLYHFYPLFRGLSGVIMWNANEIDTLQLELTDQYGTSRKRLAKIWYNNDLVWDESNAPSPNDRYFEIIK